MKKLILSTAAIMLCIGSWSQNVNKITSSHMGLSPQKQNIIIPNVDGMKVLKCDFHIHTMFSDGQVWPTTRIDEAWRDGLDAIAITDHIEYRPYRKYTNNDMNTSYELAKNHADKKGVILIKGTEITRDKPDGGHLNVLFIKDANPIDTKNVADQVDEAHRQGAYIIWNHPGWAVDSCIMYEPNRRWISEGKIQALEVFNEKEYYPRATTWARDHKLSPMACSDVHSPIDMLYARGIRRPITLVLAAEASHDALREAMFARRTIAWFDNQLAGDAKLLEKLFRASVAVEINDSGARKLTNNSDLSFVIKTANGITKLSPRSVVMVSVPKGFKGDLTADIKNAHTSENTCLQVVL